MRTRLVIGCVAALATAALALSPALPPASLTDLPPEVMCAPTVQYWIDGSGQVIHTPTLADARRADELGMLAPGTKLDSRHGEDPKAEQDQIDEYQWSMHGHCHHQDFWNTLEAQDTVQNLWNQAGGGSAWAPWFGYPACAEGAVVYVDCYNGYMYCRNIDDGTLIWSRSLQASYYYPGSPVIFEGTGGEPWVAVPNYGSAGSTPQISCFELSDGTPVWSRGMPLGTAGASGTNMNFNRAVYYNGYIYMLSLEFYSPYGGVLARFDAITGDTVRMSNRGSACVAGLTIDETNGYGYWPRWNPASPGNCRALKISLTSPFNVTDSSPLQSNYLKGSLAFNPVTRRLFCEGSPSTSGAGIMACYNADNLAAGTIWTAATSGGHDAQCTGIDDVNAYVTTQSNPGRLYAFKQSDGTAPTGWPVASYVTVPTSSGIYDGGVCVTGESPGRRDLYLTPGYYNGGNVWQVNAENGTTRAFHNMSTSEYMFTGAARPLNYFVSKSGYGRVYCWEVPGDIAVKENDVGIEQLIEPAGAMLVPGQVYTPTYSIKNYGTLPQADFAIGFIIENALGDTIYNEVGLASLDTAVTDTVTWPTWQCTTAMFVGYKFIAYTALVGDQRPGNDVKTLNAMTSTDTVYSYNGATPPSIDGYMDVGEWDDAFPFDATNIFGWGGAIQSPGSAYAWFKHDGNNMYLAFAMPDAGSRDISDQIGFYCDEDYDRAWPLTGTMEGNYWFWVNGLGTDEVLYRWFTVDTFGQPLSVPGTEIGSGTLNGYLVFEVKCPFGALPYRLTVNPSDDTVGLWMFELDGSNLFGWWPMMMPDSLWRDPAYYGTLLYKTLQNGDVEMTNIQAPVGLIPPGTSVAPRGTWRNNGPGTAMSFTALCYLENPSATRVYTGSVPVSALPVGSTTTITFPSYTVTDIGPWIVKCSTMVGGDNNPANNYKTAPFAVGYAGDFGVTQIVGPTGAFDTMVDVTPQARVRCYFVTGTANANIYYRMYLDSNDSLLYDQVITWSGVTSPGESLFTFPLRNTEHLTGRWVTVCSVYAAVDTLHGNDKKTGSFYVGGPDRPYGWAEWTAMPIGGKPVKAGGWIAFGDGVVYGAKGNKVPEFYAFDPATAAWATKATIITPSGKPPYKGAAGTADGNGHAYATVGNNTQDFLKYTAETDSWKQMGNVPLGVSGKKVKKGTGLAWFMTGDTGWVFCMKGYKDEFYKYDFVLDSFRTLPSPPVGSGAKYNDGSFCAWDGESLIYVQKAKYHDFYTFNVYTNAWTQKTKTMPLSSRYTGKSKKSKNGATGAFSIPNACLYALKGGNTQDFFKYVPLGDSWSELETIPAMGSTGKKKKVKDGGSMTPAWDFVFALKGNKTVEFWTYRERPAPFQTPRAGRASVMAGPAVLTGNGVSIAPNPLRSGVATVRYNLPRAGAATLTVFDVTGRALVSQSLLGTRTGAVNLDLQQLGAGVYLVRLDADGYTTTHKLIVER